MVQQATNFLDEKNYKDLLEQYESMPETVKEAIKAIVTPVAEPVAEVFAAEPIQVTSGLVTRAFAFGVMLGAFIVLLAKALP